ncbi:hypothetical protein M5689_003009 [Euphorbia peplus]|nr:hypothetical protein M5689_003009 [Euphorbia peplus]
MSRLEMLWVLHDLGYDSCGSIFYKNGMTGKLFGVENDRDVITMVNCIGDSGIVEVFVDRTHSLDFNESHTGGAHRDARVDTVANMVINTIPNTEEEINEGYDLVEIDLQVGDGEKDEDADLSTDSSSEESSDNSEKDPDYDRDVNVHDSDASEFEEDLARVRESIARDKKRDRSNRKRRKAPVAVQLGPLRRDKVYDPSIHKHERDKEGLIAGDEEYIRSSDLESFATDDDEEGPRKRRTTRVHYNPAWEDPVFEVGMIFKTVQDFRDAVTLYAVKRGARLKCDPNDSERCRAKCK